ARDRELRLDLSSVSISPYEGGALELVRVGGLRRLEGPAARPDPEAGRPRPQARRQVAAGRPRPDLQAGGRGPRVTEPPARGGMVSASSYPHLGGAERQALELSLALKERGVSVRVLTRRLDGLAASEEVRGIPVERLWRAGRGLWDSA